MEFRAREHSDLDSIRLKRFIQSIETDIEILTQLAQAYGAIIKLNGKKVAVVPRDSLEGQLATAVGNWLLLSTVYAILTASSKKRNSVTRLKCQRSPLVDGKVRWGLVMRLGLVRRWRLRRGWMARVLTRQWSPVGRVYTASGM